MFDGFGQVDATLKTVVEGGVLAIAAFLLVVVVLQLILIGVIIRYFGGETQRGDKHLEKFIGMYGEQNEERRALTKIVENNTSAVDKVSAYVQNSQHDIIAAIDRQTAASTSLIDSIRNMNQDLKEWPKLVDGTLTLFGERFNTLVGEIVTNRDASSSRFHQAEERLVSIDRKLDTVKEQNANIIQILSPEVTADDQQTTEI